MKFYKYECMGCKNTIEINKQIVGILKNPGCSICKSTAFKLVGEKMIKYRLIESAIMCACIISLTLGLAWLNMH